MKLVPAAVALVCSWAVLVPASAIDIPKPGGAGRMAETVQQQTPAPPFELMPEEAPEAPPQATPQPTPESKPSPGSQKQERCFVGCWNACWGFHCVERCRCRCSDEKPDYCGKLIWGLRRIAWPPPSSPSTPADLQPPVSEP